MGADQGSSPKGTDAPHSANISDDQEHRLLIHHASITERTEEALKEARKAHAKAVKDAENEGISKQDMKDYRELKTPEGELKFKARVERKLRIAQWLGLPTGIQGDLFPKIDRTPLKERAFGAGKRAGMEGKGSGDNPHDLNNEGGRAWEAGRQEGVSVKLASGIKPMDQSDTTASIIPANRPDAAPVTSNDDGPGDDGDEALDDTAGDDREIHGGVDVAKPGPDTPDEEWEGAGKPDAEVDPLDPPANA